LPGNAAQFVELDGGVLRAITRQKLEIFDRQKEFVAIGIMQFKAIMRRARRLDCLQPGKTSDPMIDMDDDITRRECSDLGQEILGAACLAAAAEQPVAKISCSATTARLCASKPCSMPMTARGRVLGASAKA